MPNEIVHQIKNEYETAIAAGGVAAEALKGATKVIASRMFQRGSVILEFLQNAEDANSKEFSIELSADKVIFENSGDPFLSENVKSLCSIGNSAKLISGGYLGYFGIGFKSSFRVSEKVEVYSGDYAFKFDRHCWPSKEPDFPWQIVPYAMDGVPGGKGARFICTLDIGEKGKRSINSLVERSEHLGRAFMFLKKVENLTWKDNITHTIKTFSKFVEKETIISENPKTWQVELVLHLGVTDKDKEKWLLFKRVVPIPDEIKSAPETAESGRELLKEREIVVGFQLSEDGGLKKAPGASIYGGIFSHLPLTAEQANLPFIIQGDFISEGGRDALDEAHPWNHWMLRSAADLLVDVSNVFKNHPKWKYQFLDLLLGQSPATIPVRIHFFDYLKTKLKDSSIVLTDDNQWVVPSSCIVQESDLDDFSKIIGSLAYQEISGQTKWFINSNIVNRTAVRDQLNCSRFIRTDFVSVLMNAKWDAYLSRKSKSENASIWFQRLYLTLSKLILPQISQYKAKPWVLTTDLGLVSGKEARLPSEHIDNVPDSLMTLIFHLSPDALVHSDLIQDGEKGESVKTFLKSLDVGTATIDWFVEKKLLPVIETEKWKTVGNTEKNDAIKVIFKWFSLNPNRGKRVLYDWNASRKFTLPTKNAGVWKPTYQLYIPGECGGKLEHFLNILDGWEESFPDPMRFTETPETEECKLFLDCVGVASKLRAVSNQILIDDKLSADFSEQVKTKLNGKTVEYQTIEYIEQLFDKWAQINDNSLFFYMASIWSDNDEKRKLFESPAISILDHNEKDKDYSGWSPLLFYANHSNWIPTDEGFKSPISLQQKPAFWTLETDKAVIHGLAPIVQAELNDIDSEFLSFCGIEDASQGLSEDDLILITRLLSTMSWTKENVESRIKLIFKRLSNIDGGISQHKDLPLLTQLYKWVPTERIYVDDCDDAALFLEDLDFAWIPKENAEQYRSVLSSLGVHFSSLDLVKTYSTVKSLGGYPYVSVLLIKAGVVDALVERFEQLDEILTLGVFSKQRPILINIEKPQNGNIHVLLHKDFSVSDPEISQLQEHLQLFIPGVNLVEIDTTDVIEQVAVDQVIYREEQQKNQSLKKAAIGSGFDYHASGKQGIYKIEVKGRGIKGDVTLIGEEPDAAKQYGKSYLLYVVYNCHSPEPQIKSSLDPASEWEEKAKTDYVVPEKTWSNWQ